MSSKRRITLTLPDEILASAAKIAKVRNVNLGTVIAEAIADGLRVKAASERGQLVLESSRRAFAGFSDSERLLLDGIVLDERSDLNPGSQQPGRLLVNPQRH